MSNQVRIWLILCALLVLAMVVLGGYTRLTESGLSIVEWKPVTGVIYPLSDESWQQQFNLYQNSPEFRLKNYNIDIEAFKEIYFIEWSHRLLGRLLGIIFTIPFCYFYLKRKLTKTLIKPLILIFILGAIQGFIGWCMVKSGLSVRPEVSQYRLALHLDMALAIYGLIMWQVFNSICDVSSWSFPKVNFKIIIFSIGVFGVLILQITSGALVAGLDAGLIYNTYPLMDGVLVPADLWDLNPWYMNLSENITMVQFIHRNLALLTFALIILLVIVVSRKNQSHLLKMSLISLLVIMTVQFCLGILTLINVVPVYLGLLHQFGAIMIFTNLLFVINLLKSRPYINRQEHHGL